MILKHFYKTISDLNGEAKVRGLSLSELKKQTEILIIDDEEFALLDALLKHEYNLTQKKDISDLRDVEAFKIILCDIRGVGNFLESKYAGAYLIKQLKEKYPQKIIIAYTANDYNAEFQKYLEYADKTIPKGAYGLEDWTSLLDQLLMENADPQKVWEKTRQALIEANVSILDIAKYESDYVKAIQRGKFESFQKIYEKQSGKGAEIMLALFKSLPSFISLIKGV